MAVTVTHSKTLLNPDSGTEDKVYGEDYVAADSHTVTGADTIVGITGTKAQFDTALTDGDFVYQSTAPTLTGTNISGTAAGLTAGNVTTNANLSGVINSVGNVTSTNAQTGTGSVFAMQASPTFTGTLTAATIVDSALTSGRITYAGASGLLKDNAVMTFDGNTISVTHSTTANAFSGSGSIGRILLSATTNGSNSGYKWSAKSANGTTRTGGVYLIPGDTAAGTLVGVYPDDGATSAVLSITGTGLVGIDIAATAVLTLPAGTAVANTMPEQLTTGARETTARVGGREYDSNHYVTNWKLLRYPLGGPIFDYFADVSVGGAEADIFSSTLLANTFAINGDKVIASYGGNFVTGGTELTQLLVKFDATGATTLWDSTGLAPATGTTSWRVLVELIRVSSTVVRYVVSLQTSGASGFVYCTSGEITGLTLTATTALKLRGASSGVGSGAGDLVGKQGSVMYYPAV